MSEFGNSPESLIPRPCVLHGSYGRNLGAIHEAATILESTGLIKIIEPTDFDVVGYEDGFPLFVGQEGLDPREIELRFLQNVLSLKALGGCSYWITGPDKGQLGKSAAFEYGLAKAYGVRTYFSDQPQDVPFYVPRSAVMRPAMLAEYLVEHDGEFPTINPEEDAIGRAWHRGLLMPAAHVAVGGVVRHRDRILLVEDGMWEGGKLTVAGRTQLTGETREEALRKLEDKFGVRIRSILPLLTSFMIEGSGYRRPVVDKVFDDRIIDVANERLHPQPGLVGHWVSAAETSGLIASGDIEPNASRLLEHYFVAARHE